MNNLKYTIKEYNDFTKTLIVDFGIDGWAQIVLASPLPKDQIELESIIRRWAPAQEQVQAKIESTDLSYIEGLVGHTYETSRFKLHGEFSEVTAPTDEQMAEMEKIEHEFLKEKIVSILSELGMIKVI